ncbi:hypothetical protein RAMLITH_22640 [Ramlibacter sp. RBP-2]|uniref:Uncharacterized protein n=1 Tax=Ramlibacter lithotrophicus TaxID=2606681 RepID=A0A7X6DK27_9BURK|nr:hypothetical protein [Ramlibacter lithotrophicus]NKE68623.1 hypothetical protein [Ramlibacter lithotrophicus]
MGLDQLFDTYSLRARHLPTVLVVAPPLMVASLLFPKVYDRMGASMTSVSVSVSLSLVFLFFIAHVLRQRGRAVEKKMTAEAGGMPTTCWLRHKDTNLDPVTKARYHGYLGKNVPGLNVPSQSQEQQRPEMADDTYRSAVKWLLEKTRDTAKYPLVLKENAEYGFRRNMFGGKWLAITLCVLPLAAAYAWDAYKGVGPQFDNDHVAAIAIAVVAVLAWLFFVTKEWVRDASHAYARALLATCEA